MLLFMVVPAYFLSGSAILRCYGVENFAGNFIQEIGMKQNA